MTQTLWPSSDIHKMPGPDLTPNGGGLDWDRIQAFARFTLESFIGQIAIAFGGIDILGWKPFDFLAEWGQARIDDAAANYLAATTAQNAANYANAQLTALLVSDVSGGVALNSTFDGAAASSLGGSWTQAYAGPGGGTLGLDGSGQTVWNTSGSFWRAGLAAYTTPLSTDYQRGRVIVTKLPQEPNFGGTPALYILLRVNSAATVAVFARIRFNEVAIGYWSSGTETVLATQSVTPAIGDTWDFYAGTDVDDYQFLIKRNGSTVLTYTNSGHATSMGSGYRYVGIAAAATDRNVFTASSDPGKITAWGAIDRLPATV